VRRGEHSAIRFGRYNLVFALLILFATGLCVRLVMLVYRRDGSTAQKAMIQQRMVIPSPGRCGSIFARSHQRYVQLALSRQIPSCYVDPFLLSDRELSDVSARVAGALNMDAREILSKILQRRHRRFVYLKRGINDDEATAVRKLRIPAVSITHEWRRAYPNKELAGTVVGFRRFDGAPGGGLELSLDSQLAGQDGRRVMLADAHRRPIWPLIAESRPPSDGASVFLCLDTVIQG
jgi:cell division protein FtsI/penicillin-binding protein 2